MGSGNPVGLRRLLRRASYISAPCGRVQVRVGSGAGLSSGGSCGRHCYGLPRLSVWFDVDIVGGLAVGTNGGLAAETALGFVVDIALPWMSPWACRGLLMGLAVDIAVGLTVDISVGLVCR